MAGTIGLLVLGGAFLAVHLISPGGLGFGDLRLAALCGTTSHSARASLQRRYASTARLEPASSG
jgi:hypothetical protein